MSNDENATPPGGLAGIVSDIALAIGFLSRLPTSDAALSAGRLARAARAFPVAGLGIGALAAIVYIAASAFGVAPWIAALLTVAMLIWLTRGLHEDGLADFSDGLGASEPGRRLEIMRDSRIGTFGVLALGLVVALRIATLAELADPTLVAQTLIAAAALSRAAMVVLMARLPLARSEGMAHHAGTPGKEDELVAAAVGLAAIFLLLPWIPALVGLVVAGASLALVAWLTQERLGGITGDVLGAAQQVVEVGFLLAVTVVLV